MRITAKSKLIAGQDFTVSVSHIGGGARDPITVAAWAGEQHLGEEECENPPCYEMVFHIPRDISSSMVTLHARSTTGKVATFVLPIETPKRSPEPEMEA